MQDKEPTVSTMTGIQMISLLNHEKVHAVVDGMHITDWGFDSKENIYFERCSRVIGRVSSSVINNKLLITVTDGVLSFPTHPDTKIRELKFILSSHVQNDLLEKFATE